MASNKSQTGLRFPEELLEKIKYVAFMERRSITNTVLIGMEEFIKNWEVENGAITPALLKKVPKK